MAVGQTFTLGGKEVTLSAENIERAVWKVQPGPIKKYSVKIRGVRYPIKQLISLASGLPSAMFIATDAHRILRRLGFEVETEPAPGPEKVTLGLQPIGRVSDGPIFGSGNVYQYRVTHMPVGHQALIANFGAPLRSDWRIMRIDDDMQEEWNGHYESAEEALAILQKEFE